MANPQFRNVALNLSDPSRATSVAGALFDKAFQGIKGIADEQGELQKTNVDNATKQNTAKIISEIQANKDLETTDQTSADIISGLSSRFDGDINTGGFDLNAINQAASDHRGSLLDTKVKTQQIKENELNITSKELQAKFENQRLMDEEKARQNGLNMDRLTEQESRWLFQQRKQDRKIVETNRAAFDGFKQVQGEWLAAISASQDMNPADMTPQQQALINKAPADLVREYIAGSDADAATIDQITKFQQNSVGLDIVTPEIARERAATIAAAEQKGKEDLAKIKGDYLLDAARIRAAGPKKPKYTDSVGGLYKGIRDIMQGLPEELRKDDNNNRVSDYGWEIYKNWKDLGLNAQPNVNDLLTAIEIGIEIQVGDDDFFEAVLTKSDVTGILKNLEFGENDPEMIGDGIKAKRLAAANQAKANAEAELRQQLHNQSQQL